MSRVVGRWMIGFAFGSLLVAGWWWFLVRGAPAIYRWVSGGTSTCWTATARRYCWRAAASTSSTAAKAWESATAGGWV